MKPQDLQTLAQAALMPARYNDQPTAADAIADKVDTLGALRAVIADLQEQAELIRTELERAGLPHIQGKHYTATVTQCKGAARTDWRTIAERFKPSAQLIRAHTVTGKDSTRLTITARQITH